MGYQDFVNEQDQAHRPEEVTRNLIQWNDIGQTVIGKLLQVETFEGTKYDTTCLSYLIDTDDGLYSFLLGAATDKAIRAEELINHVIKVRFDGKLELGDTRRVNQFRIWDYGLAT